MITATNTTVLSLSGFNQSPYATRGLSQSVTPIPQAVSLARTVNGALVNLAATQFQKFAFSISGNDVDPPAFDGLWPGQATTLQCLVEFAIEGSIGTAGFDRTPVTGSIREESGFTFYRAEVACLVTGFSIERNEWGAATSWTLVLEEV